MRRQLDSKPLPRTHIVPTRSTRANTGSSNSVDLTVRDEKLSQRFGRRDADIKAAEWKAVAREQERISAELHDGLGQHLTGTAFLAKALANKLHARGSPEAGEAEQIVALTNQAVAYTRQLARGLQPVGPEDNALSVALLQLAAEVSKVYGVRCKFSADDTVLIFSRDAAHHLYRIAQEAVNNAITHGGADEIVLELRKQGRGIVLSITNNGSAFVDDIGHMGLGLFSMRRRARILRAKFILENLPAGGVRLQIVMGGKISKVERPRDDQS